MWLQWGGFYFRRANMDEVLKRFIDRGVLGKPGDPVPQVNPEDLKVIWRLYEDVKVDRPEEQVGIGWRLILASCRPGVDAKSVWYRTMALQSLMQVQKQAAEHELSLRDLISFKERPEAQTIKSAESADWKVELNEAVFRVIAEMPMQWGGSGRQSGRQSGFLFDVEDFVRRVGAA